MRKKRTHKSSSLVTGEPAPNGEQTNLAERQQAVVALRENEDRYKDLVEHSHDMIYTHDLSGVVLFANQTSSQLLGLAPSEVVGKRLTEFLVPEVRDQFDAYLAEIRENGMASGLMLVQTSTGETRVCEYNNSLRTDGLGGPIVRCIARDVTERGRVEEALRQAEEKYRTIFENAVEGIYRTTAGGGFITANPAMARMLGFSSPEELIREHDRDKPSCLDPERREELKRLLDEHGLVRGFEYQGHKKDGGKIWLSDSVRAVCDENGAVLYYEGIAEDITERKRAETKSSAFAALAQKLSGATVPLEAARIIVDTADELFGWDSCTFDLYDPKEDLIHGILRIDTIEGSRSDVPPDLETRPPTAKGRGVIERGPRLTLREAPYKFDDDTLSFGNKDRALASIMSVPIRHAAEVVGILSIQSYAPQFYDHNDLSDLQALADHCGQALNRIWAEEELRESEERYHDLVENSREMICTHDMDGRVLSANRAVAEALGYDSNEVLEGKSLRDVLAPEVRHEFDEYMARLWKDGATSGVMLVVTSTGERRLWEYYNSLRTDGVSKPIVRAMARDITDRKRSEQALRESEERLRAIAEGTRALLMSVDANGYFTYANDASARAVGLASPEELIGKSYLHFVHHEDRERVLDGFTNQVKRRQPSSMQEFRIVDTAGNVKWFSFLSTVTIKDGEFVGQSGVAQDITERKQAEEALRASEEKYRTILERMEEGYAEVDLRGTYVFVNDSFCRITGRSRSELLGVNYKEVFDREQSQLLYETYHNVYVTGEPVTGFEYVVTRKDGTRRLVEESVILKRDAEGQPIGFTGIRRDCTERKQAEEALRESEERYRELFEQASDMIYTTDESGIWLALNPASLQLLKFSEKELLGQSQFDLIRPDYREPFKEFYRQQYLQKIPSTFYSFPVIAKDGTEIWIEQNGTLLSDRDRVAGFHFVARNITQRKRAEEELRRSEQRFAAFMNNTSALTWMKDNDFRYVYANEPFARLLGCGVNDIVGKTDFELLPPETAQQFRANDEAVLASEELLETQETIRTTDGELRWSRVYKFPIQDADGRICVGGMAIDITERKRAEEALRESESFRRTIFDSEPECVKVVGRDFALLDMNPAGLEMIGASRREQVIGQSVLALIAPEWRDAFTEMHQRVLRGESVVAEFETCGLDGVRKWMETHAVPLRDKEQMVIGQLAITRDITERRRAEAALRESEERYRDLVENIQDLVCTHDLEGRVLSANPALEKLLGYNLKDFGEKTFRKILAPEARDKFDDYLVRIRRDGVASGLMLVQTSTGERRVWEYHNTLRTEGVATPIVRSMARDITERRRAEEATADLRRELELTMSAMEEGVHRVDLDGNIVFENPAAARMLGWEVAELLGKRGHLTMHHTRQDGTPYPIEECPIYASFRDGVSRHVTDEVFWRQDGTSFPVEYTTAPMRDDRNELVATVVTFRDITERKRAEAALRESEERYREFFENAKDALYIHDLSGRYVSFNRAAERLSGFSRDEILGKHFSNFVSPTHLKYTRENLCKKLDIEVETTYEIDLVTKDRRRVPVEVSSRLIYENGERVGVQGTARDITDRKRAQEAQRIYSQRLIQAQEAERGKIARELHDEIGQVLTAVRINLQSMQHSSGLDENLPRLDESIGIVDEALGRVRELSIELRPSLLDDLGLSAALRWYVDRYAQRTGISAEVLNGFQEDGRLPRDLETACFRIAQEALTNVARHACAASVSVQLEREPERMLLTIIDDGVGFDFDELKKNASPASALGLRGMEERALAVGGYIEIDSGLERGTRIRAAFPLKRK